MTTEDDTPTRDPTVCGWRWRVATGLNVSVAIILAAVLLVMVNYLFLRMGPMRWSLDDSAWYRLSDKTKSLLANLERPVDVIAFFNRDDELFPYVRGLLREYEFTAAEMGQQNLRIEILDPDRDLVRTRALQQKYRLSEPNIVVFDCEGRCKYIEPRNIVDKQHNVDIAKVLAQKRGGIVREVTYLGEQAFSSAIMSVTQTRRPTVYFLSGHGEREIDDFSKPSGFSGVARALTRDNMVVKTLNLSEHGRVPADGSALVIAGPTRRMSRGEVDLIGSYLDRNGRLYLMVGPGVVTGLEGLLESWGVKLDMDVVIDPGSTVTGREIYASRYGVHPITRQLRNVWLMFFLPRSVEVMPGHEGTGDVQADKSRVFTLVSSSDKSRATRNPKGSSAKYDAGQDRPGPISLAVAVEKGPISGIEVEIRPTRIIVLGDVEMVSNGALDAAVGGNIDFFMNGINWLVERESLMAIGPKSPEKLVWGMNRARKKLAFLVVVFACPVAAALTGLLVWWRRRR